MVPNRGVAVDALETIKGKDFFERHLKYEEFLFLRVMENYALWEFRL